MARRVTVTINAAPLAMPWDVKELELELAFSTEPIQAWRVWRVHDLARYGGVVEPRLTSIGIGDIVWHPRRRAEAICVPSPFRLARQFPYAAGYLRFGVCPPPVHESPWPTCECGLWGLREESVVREIAQQHKTPAAERAPFVFGRVALWGRIVEQQRGWRAQYAYPQELITYDATIADELERTYGVPVRVEERPPSPPPELPSELMGQALAGYATALQHYTPPLLALSSGPQLPSPEEAAARPRLFARVRHWLFGD